MKLILGLVIGLTLGMLATVSADWLQEELARRDQMQQFNELQRQQDQLRSQQEETNRLLRQQRPC